MLWELPKSIKIVTGMWAMWPSNLKVWVEGVPDKA